MNTETLIRVADGDLFVGQSRVLLENIVTANRRGETAEQIQENFPSLSLQQVYGALVYYLDHQTELDARFAEDQQALDDAHAANRAAHAEFFEDMRARSNRARDSRSALGETQPNLNDTAINA